MNPKIELLAKQVNEWVEEDGHSYSRQAWNEKFAQLIVKECMKLNCKELSITAIEQLLPLYQDQFGVE